MITRLLVLLALIASLCTGYTASVTLAWDPSPDTNVTGYFLCFGTNSGSYQWTNETASTVCTSVVSTLETNGTIYYFAVLAFDANGNLSDFSNEIWYDPVNRVSNSPPTESPDVLRTKAKRVNAKKAKVGAVKRRR